LLERFKRLANHKKDDLNIKQGTSCGVKLTGN